MALDLYFMFGVFQCIIQTVTIIANLMTILAFSMVRSLRTHSSNIFIYVLSFTDLIWGIYVILYYGIPYVFDLSPPLGEIGCMITVPFEYIYSAGNMILVAISIDRVLMVTLDYSKYMRMLTALRLKITIGCCFLFGLVGTIIELSLWNFAKRHNINAANIDFQKACMYPPRRMKWIGFYIAVCFFLLPLLLVGFFSGLFVNRLLVRIHKRSQIGDVSTCSVRAPSESTTTSHGETGSTGVNEANVPKKRYTKAAVTLAALVSAMYITMLPYCVYLFVAGFSGSVSVEVTYIMWLIIQLNPMLDPLFYAATQKDIRVFYRNKIRGLFR